MMKKAILVALCAVALLAGCSKNHKAEKVVEMCWEYLSDGQWDKAVALMDVSGEEALLYEEIYAEQSGELMRAGGMDDFQLLGSIVGADSARVDAVVTLADGQQIEASYKLVLRDGEWKIAN